MLRLARVDLFSRGQQAIVERHAGVVEHALGEQPVRANVVRKDHAVKDDFGILRHDSLVSL